MSLFIAPPGLGRFSSGVSAFAAQGSVGWLTDGRLILFPHPPG
jgi:hypothetical protein